MCPIVFMKIQLGMMRDRIKSKMANAKAKGVRIGRPQLTKDKILFCFQHNSPRKIKKSAL